MTGRKRKMQRKRRAIIRCIRMNMVRRKRMITRDKMKREDKDRTQGIKDRTDRQVGILTDRER